MCCWTHNDPCYPGPLASETVDDRCRCPCGGEQMPCQRRATEEDIRCDVCAGRIRISEHVEQQRPVDPNPGWQRFERPVVIEPAWEPDIILPWQDPLSPPGAPPGMPGPGP